MQRTQGNGRKRLGSAALVGVAFLVAAAAAGAAAQAVAGKVSPQPLFGVHCSPTPPAKDCVDTWVCVDGAWQPDTYLPAGTPCGGLLATCKTTGTCNGGATCTGQQNLPAGTVCRAATSACMQNATCAGNGSACPSTNPYVPAGTVCRSTSSLCSFDATCTGASYTCPSNPPAPAGAPCGGAGAPCASSCSGSGACSSGIKAARGAACPYPSACAQVCDGVSVTCQPME